MSQIKSKDIDEHIAKAIKSETPDMLDDLLNEIDAADTAEAAEIVSAAAKSASAAAKPVNVRAASSNKKSLKRNTWIKALAGVAAVFVLFVGIRAMMAKQMEAFAVIGLDVNPGIELAINQDERVIGATAINDEAKEILSDMKLDGSDINVACNAIVGSMLTHGYLTTDSNSVLVSVRSGDTTKGKALEQKLSGNLNSYLENSDIAAAILGQYVEDDDELEAFSKENGISLGKAWLIRNLMASGNPKYTEESLLKLSTQELILLGQKKTVKKEDFYGEASTSKYIKAEKAEAIALEHAGITLDQAENINAELDCDDGVIVYEVDFVAGGYEYEYDIDAVSGKVILSEKEKSDSYDSDNDDADDDDRFDDEDDSDNDDRDDDDRYDDDRDDRDDRDDGDRYDDDDDDDDDREVKKKSSSKSKTKYRDDDDDDDDDDDEDDD